MRLCACTATGKSPDAFRACRGYFLWIETHAAATFAGTVSLRLPAYDDEPWTTDTRLGILGYAIVADQQGRGFAT